MNGREVKKMASTPMSAELAAEIIRLHRERPELHQHEIAALLRINQGRVSEVLSGKAYGHLLKAA